MRPELVNNVSVELIDCLASDDMVALAAWVSHATDETERLADREGVRKLINFLYREKHMSPFEHGTFIFKVRVPIFVAREWHRHRTQSYNEMSGRYTEMLPIFYLPRRERPLVQEGKPGNYTFVQGSDDQYAIVRTNIEESVEQSWAAYQNMLASGVAKEVARMVLPVNIFTEFYVTVNPRNLMQFLTLRNDEHALEEIRTAAGLMEDIFAEKMPFTAKAFKKYRKREKWAANQPEYLWDEEQEAPKNPYNVTINIKDPGIDEDNLARKVEAALQRSINRRAR